MPVKKDKRGRKKMNAKEKKVAIYTMVPGKHKVKAKKEINKIGEKWCAI